MCIIEAKKIATHHQHQVRDGSTLYFSLGKVSQRTCAVDEERGLPRDSNGSKFVRVTLFQVSGLQRQTLHPLPTFPIDAECHRGENVSFGYILSDGSSLS